jgi:hypothetical protein
MWVSQSTTLVGSAPTYNALLVDRHDPFPDPDAPTAHPVGQHHVRGEPVADNGDVSRAGYPSLRVASEVLHDLRSAARLLYLVGKHCYPGAGFQFGGKFQLAVPRCRSCCVGYDEQAATWICLFQRLKVRLLSAAMLEEASRIEAAGSEACLVRFVDIVRLRVGKTIILV